MSVDTLIKRYSVLATLHPVRYFVPIPNADTFIRLEDRQILCGMYAGRAGSAPRRNIAIFGLFAVVPKISVERLDLFTRVQSPVMTLRPTVVFEHGVSFQEKPAGHLPAVTQDYTLPPAPVFPIATDEPPVPPPPPDPGPPPPDPEPDVLHLAATEEWDAEASTVVLRLAFTETWDSTDETVTPLRLAYTEVWDTGVQALFLAYTELWDV